MQTFEAHEFTVGGKAAYYMTGPDGTKARGWWKFTSINSPDHLEFDDGFADEQGEPVNDLGITHATVKLEPLENRTRMTITSTFDSEEQMQKMAEMGMEEGMREAVEQIDSVLTESANA
ncbi:hypothetical protein ARTHRO9V_40067 [Arthrobacter sp. 9V]|nr:hypothetical protein ARTHRO9V_40067 [Arthrobacter sp. 9V]